MNPKSMHAWYGTREHRLIGRGDIRQGFEDLKNRHVRTDGIVEMFGSVIMVPAVVAAKAFNTVVGEFNDKEAEPLKDGAFSYIGRDARSAAGNLLQAGKNLATLHPLRAGVNIFKVIVDAGDLFIVDPLLDAGSIAFGHTRRQAYAALSYSEIVTPTASGPIPSFEPIYVGAGMPEAETATQQPHAVVPAAKISKPSHNTEPSFVLAS